MRDILRIGIRLITLVAVSAIITAEPARATSTHAGCGNCAGGNEQCRDLGLFPDRCPTFCGAETYATGCADAGCGAGSLYVTCGFIS
jgi:hypothetical protein